MTNFYQFNRTLFHEYQSYIIGTPASKIQLKQSFTFTNWETKEQLLLSDTLLDKRKATDSIVRKVLDKQKILKEDYIGLLLNDL